MFDHVWMWTIWHNQDTVPKQIIVSSYEQKPKDQFKEDRYAEMYVL